jgi:hypothetical protein
MSTAWGLIPSGIAAGVPTLKLTCHLRSSEPNRVPQSTTYEVILFIFHLHRQFRFAVVRERIVYLVLRRYLSG